MQSQAQIQNYKKLCLFVILDAYVTKNAIEDFLPKSEEEINSIIKELFVNHNPESIRIKIDDYINKLIVELCLIEEFLSDESNIYWTTLGYNRKFFDKNLPKYKRKIKWFHSIDRYPFDCNIFFNADGELR